MPVARNPLAFPNTFDDNSWGLTRREYYAAAALPAVIEKFVAFYAMSDPRFASGVAEAAARVADAMITTLEAKEAK